MFIHIYIGMILMCKHSNRDLVYLQTKIESSSAGIFKFSEPVETIVGGGGCYSV